MISKKYRLDLLISHYSNGNKSQFAKMLGIRPQTINSWMLRNTYDAELIYAKCEGISGDWLLSGEGEMLKQPSQNEHINSELLNLCKSLVANYQQRNEMMEQLISIINNN